MNKIQNCSKNDFIKRARVVVSFRNSPKCYKFEFRAQKNKIDTTHDLKLPYTSFYLFLFNL